MMARSQLLQLAIVLTAVALAVSLLGVSSNSGASKASLPRVTADFVNTDRVVALKEVARQCGRSVYIGPTVAGQVTLSFKGTPGEEAFAQLLADLPEHDFKLLGTVRPAVVIASLEKLDEIRDDIGGGCTTTRPSAIPENAVRVEYLLEEAPSAKVVDYLSGKYDRVQFRQHPTMNGFYANGSREDLLQIKQELATLDQTPEPSPPLGRPILVVRHADPSKTRDHLATLVPDATIQVDTHLSALTVEGPPGTFEQVQELLAKLDRP